MSDREDFERRIFSYYPPLQRVREFVEKNLSEPISLREAASAAGLEEKYFSAFFHRKTGVRFRDWLAGRRVDRAIEILTQHDETITSVAESTGFQDLRTFERSFKRLTGLTPRDFKRSVAPEMIATAPPLPAVEVAEVAEPLPQQVETVPRATLPQRVGTGPGETLPVYVAVGPLASNLGPGLRDLERLPVPSFLMATP